MSATEARGAPALYCLAADVREIFDFNHTVQSLLLKYTAPGLRGIRDQAVAGNAHLYNLIAMEDWLIRVLPNASEAQMAELRRRSVLYAPKLSWAERQGVERIGARRIEAAQ